MLSLAAAMGTSDDASSTMLTTLPVGISRSFLAHRRLAPMRVVPDGVVEVLAAPGALLDDLHILTEALGGEIQVVPASAAIVATQLERLTSPTIAGAPAPPPVRPAAEEDAGPVAHYVNAMLETALTARVTDLHLEPSRDGPTLRGRVDGVLVALAPPPERLFEGVLSRLKLLAGCDIAERRRPQDGRFTYTSATPHCDVRVAVIPTLYGESVVLRLLQSDSIAVSLPNLGLLPAQLARLDGISKQSYGMFVVTGPTGSGKSTTCHAALAGRNRLTEKVITIEDPIERTLDGLSQVQVHNEAGTSFAAALRALLRHDPDVIFIGELRDSETASIAVQAALTGHMVFCTLHTTDALGVLPRLLDLHVPVSLASRTLTCIVAQRLVRRICAACRIDEAPSPVERAWLTANGLSRTTVARGTGCSLCLNTGYHGRLGIFEILEPTEELRECWAAGGSNAATRRLAGLAGWLPFSADAAAKVDAELTTVAEVLRAINH